jgi:hypothetical protein
VGRSVLVVDLGFTEKSTRSRHSEGMGGLRDLFESVTDDEETIRNRASAVIKAADMVATGLDVLVADPDIIDPSDLLAGRPLGELLEQARKQYDIVAVIQPSTGVGPGAVVDTHLQQQIIVCTRGRTTLSEIAREALPTTGIQNKVVGVVLVAPSARRVTAVPVRTAPPRRAPARREPEPEMVPEPAPVAAVADAETPAKTAKPARRTAARAKSPAASEPAEVVEPEVPEPAEVPAAAVEELGPAEEPAADDKPDAEEKPAPVEKPEPVRAPAAAAASTAPTANRRPADRTPAPRRRRSSRARQETSEAAAERLRALETYSVDESLYLKTPESPADSN